MITLVLAILVWRGLLDLKTAKRVIERLKNVKPAATIEETIIDLEAASLDIPEKIKKQKN